MWITTAPILVLPDDSKPFRIEADSLDFVTGAMLSQQSSEDNKWHLLGDRYLRAYPWFIQPFRLYSSLAYSDYTFSM